MSRFEDIDEFWHTATSKFKFSDNLWDCKRNDPKCEAGEDDVYPLGEIFFAEFEMGASKLNNCTVSCDSHTYRLQAR
jgi:hypothetical protein